MSQSTTNLHILRNYSQQGDEFRNLLNTLYLQTEGLKRLNSQGQFTQSSNGGIEIEVERLSPLEESVFSSLDMQAPQQGNWKGSLVATIRAVQGVTEKLAQLQEIVEQHAPIKEQISYLKFYLNEMGQKSHFCQEAARIQNEVLQSLQVFEKPQRLSILTTPLIKEIELDKGYELFSGFYELFLQTLKEKDSAAYSKFSSSDHEQKFVEDLFYFALTDWEDMKESDYTIFAKDMDLVFGLAASGHRYFGAGEEQRKLPEINYTYYLPLYRSCLESAALSESFKESLAFYTETRSATPSSPSVPAKSLLKRTSHISTPEIPSPYTPPALDPKFIFFNAYFSIVQKMVMQSFPGYIQLISNPQAKKDLRALFFCALDHFKAAGFEQFSGNFKILFEIAKNGYRWINIPEIREKPYPSIRKIQEFLIFESILQNAFESPSFQKSLEDYTRLAKIKSETTDGQKIPASWKMHFKHAAESADAKAWLETCSKYQQFSHSRSYNSSSAPLHEPAHFDFNVPTSSSAASMLAIASESSNAQNGSRVHADLTETFQTQQLFSTNSSSVSTGPSSGTPQTRGRLIFKHSSTSTKSSSVAALSALQQNTKTAERSQEESSSFKPSPPSSAPPASGVFRRSRLILASTPTNSSLAAANKDSLPGKDLEMPIPSQNQSSFKPSPPSSTPGTVRRFLLKTSSAATSSSLAAAGLSVLQQSANTGASSLPGNSSVTPALSSSSAATSTPDSNSSIFSSIRKLGNQGGFSMVLKDPDSDTE